MPTVREVLKAKDRPVETVQPAATVADVIGRFTDAGIRCLVVAEEDDLLGVVTIRDVLTYIGQHGGAALEETVAAVMTRDVTSVTLDTSLDEAAALFAERHFNHLPVLEDGALVGIVTPADVLDRHLEEVREDAVHLLDYISGVYS